MKKILIALFLLLSVSIHSSTTWAGVANLSLIEYPLALGNYLYVPEGQVVGVGYGIYSYDSDFESNNPTYEYDSEGSHTTFGYDVSLGESLLALNYKSFSSSSFSTLDYTNSSDSLIKDEMKSAGNLTTLGLLYAQHLGGENYFYLAANSNKYKYEQDASIWSDGVLNSSSSYHNEREADWVSTVYGLTIGSTFRFGASLQPEVVAEVENSNFDSTTKTGHGEITTLGLGYQQESYQIELDQIELKKSEDFISHYTEHSLNGQVMLSSNMLLEANLAQRDVYDDEGPSYEDTTQALAGIVKFSNLIIKCEAQHLTSYSVYSDYTMTLDILTLSLAGSF